jgi:hypothetical protein
MAAPVEVRAHAVVRARERYGLEFDNRDLAAIRAIIRAGWGPDCKPLAVSAHDDRRVIYAVWYRCRWLPVVFQERDGYVISFLPAEFLWRYRHVLLREIA